MEMIRLAIEGCRRNAIHSGLCGQAPSDYPEVAEYLVEIGIDSMSLNPDTVLKTTRQVLGVEARLNEPRALVPERRLVGDQPDRTKPVRSVPA